MHRSSRSVIAIALTVGVLASFAAPAYAAIVVGDRFNGTVLRPAWKQVDATWRVRHGAARVNIKSVNPVTNIGYAVISMKGTHKDGLRIQSKVRLSPDKSNIGIVGPYRDVGNHLFCKVEVTPAHPLGLVAVGRRIGGGEPTIMKQHAGLNLTPGGIYKLVTERHRKLITCALWQSGAAVTSIRYMMKAADVRAYGGAKKAGLRIRVVAGRNRRDEDDGRSKFLDFRVSTI